MANANEIAVAVAAGIREASNPPPQWHDMLTYIYTEYNTCSHLQTRDKPEIRFLVETAKVNQNWVAVNAMSNALKRQIMLYYYVVSSDWKTAVHNIKLYDAKQLNVPPPVLPPVVQRVVVPRPYAPRFDRGRGYHSHRGRPSRR